MIWIAASSPRIAVVFLINGNRTRKHLRNLDSNEDSIEILHRVSRSGCGAHCFTQTGW